MVLTEGMLDGEEKKGGEERREERIEGAEEENREGI